MLDRPFYDEDVVYAFFSERLLTAKADSELENLLSEFRANHGESNYRGLLSTLAWASTFPQSQRDESRNRSKAVADGILVRFYPWFDPVRPPFLDAVKFREQKDLIVRLAPFSSPDIDRAILGVFRRCLAEKRSSVSAKIQRVDLVRACADRLMGKIPQHDCVQFLEAQSRELVEDRKDPRNSSLFTAIDQRIEMIRNLVDRLTKIEAK